MEEPTTSSAPADSPAPSGVPGSAKLFVAFLMIACVLLCVMVRRLSSTNADLRAETTRLTQSLGNSSLPVGEILPDLTTFGPAAEPVKDAPKEAMRFDDGRVGTVLFVHSAGCGNCEATFPQMIALAGQYRHGGLEFVGVQTDATKPEQLTHPEANFPIRGVPDGERSWMRRVPLVPAIMIVDHEGVLRAAWYGTMNDRQEQQFRQELERAAKGYGPRTKPK